MATAPLVSNPLAIFLIVLGIILLAPVLLARLKIPHIISMIMAGIIVGPYGFNILADDSSFTIFGQVGLLYLMFLAGIEIDMYHLRLNLKRGLVFGLLTFMIPMVLGMLSSVILFGIDWLTAGLLGAMYAAHTLIAYPVAARYGVAKSPAVLIAIVGTIIAVICSLLVLGVVLNITRVGAFEVGQLAILLLRLTGYCVIVLYLYPRLTRWFFKTFGDPVSQYIFIMALVLTAALGAKVIGLEGVLGSFFAGLVLNRFVPASSTLMSRIEFVGNALFIPYFLISVGMMINVRVIIQGDTLSVAAVMLAVAIVTKWLAAWAAQKIYGMDGNDRRMMFGLTAAHTAVALAVVTIGYNTLLPDGSRMMDETMLNGTVLVILITCAIAPVVTTGAARRVKIRLLEQSDREERDTQRQQPNRVIIPIANPVTARPLVEMAMLMQPAKHDPADAMFAIHVRSDNSAGSKAVGRNSLDLARQTAAAANRAIDTIERYDLNIVSGVLNAVEERDINQIFIGMHRKATVIDSFLGAKLEQMLKMTNKMVVISRCFIPVNTVGRILVVVPAKAQFESGFVRWVHSLGNLAAELGCRIIFCCPLDVQRAVNAVLRRDKYAVRAEYRVLDDLDDFVLLAGRVRDDDLFVVIGARSNSISHSPAMGEIPGFLQKHFARHNIVMIYPEQFGDAAAIESFADPLNSDLTSMPSTWLRRLRSRLRRHSADRHFDI